MAVNITEEQAQEMRNDPDYKSGQTKACPLCDPDVQVEPGLSTPHVCQCGNVWQPLQLLSAHPTCITPDGAVSPDKLLEAFGQKAEDSAEVWVGWACKLLRQYGLQEEDYNSYSEGQLRDAISEMIQHYVT